MPLRGLGITAVYRSQTEKQEQQQQQQQRRADVELFGLREESTKKKKTKKKKKKRKILKSQKARVNLLFFFCCCCCVVLSQSPAKPQVMLTHYKDHLLPQPVLNWNGFYCFFFFFFGQSFTLIISCKPKKLMFEVRLAGSSRATFQEIKKRSCVVYRL